MLLKRHFDIKTDVFCQFMLFLTETTLRKWFPWQQGKVYSQNFDFEMLSINIGEKSESLKKISCGSKATE